MSNNERWPVTDVIFMQSLTKCPKGYTIVGITYASEEAVRAGIYRTPCKRERRVMCMQKTHPKEARRLLLDVKVNISQGLVPPGYFQTSLTVDTRQNVSNMEDICFRWVGINSHFVGHVVTGLILLDKYVPNPPLDYILVDTINGMRLFQRKHIVKAGPDFISWKDALERKLPQSALALEKENVIFNMRAPPLPRRKKYHVVFLYGHETKEKTFSDSLIGELQGSIHKYICHRLQEKIHPSKGYLQGRLEAIQESAYTVIVLTNSILKGSFYHSELLTALDNTRVVPLKIENCSISSELQEVAIIDIHSKKYDWRKQLTASLRGHAPYLPFRKTEHIFLFHNDADKRTVDAMVQGLEYPKFDLRVLSSGRDLVSGVSPRSSIKMCVEASAITVPVLSRAFVNKEWPAHEKELAEYSPVIFPLILEKCEIPDSLKGFKVFDSTRQTESWFSTWKETLITCLKSENNKFSY